MLVCRVPGGTRVGEWQPQSGLLARGETSPSLNPLAAEEYQLQDTDDGLLGNTPGTFSQMFFPTTPFAMTMEVISSRLEYFRPGFSW